jgi:hypothetical protein
MWGLYDTEDNCWMGDGHGPKLFKPEDELLAKVAAQLIDTQLRQPPGRTRAKEYNEIADKLKDEKRFTLSALKALERLENGRF